VAETDVQFLREQLAPEERSRAGRFRVAAAAESYVVAHAALRDILSRYLDIEALDIRFRSNANGKPFVADEQNPDGFSFSLSHTRNLALVATARGRRVGVDVEAIRPEALEEGMMEQTFSPDQVAVLRALPYDQRLSAFFRGWTQKEAFLKALGTGLATPLLDFDVALEAGGRSGLLRTAWDPGESRRWTLRELPMDSGFSAALAMEGAQIRLSTWRW
jgi:4'-phosphopantetheinyl transferase